MCLPEAGLVRDVVLVFEGMDLLMAHRRGMNVAKPIAAPDRVFQSEGEGRKAAIAEFVKLRRRQEKTTRRRRIDVDTQCELSIFTTTQQTWHKAAIPAQ